MDHRPLDASHREHRLSMAVLVVDDQLAVREGLARLIAASGLMLRGIHTAANSAQALALMLSVQPELVLLDVDLAGEDGLALLPQMVPKARVLVLTSHGDELTFARAQRGGASDFLNKQHPAHVVIERLCKLVPPHLRGEFSPPLAGHPYRR